VRPSQFRVGFGTVCFLPQDVHYSGVLAFTLKEPYSPYCFIFNTSEIYLLPVCEKL